MIPRIRMFGVLLLALGADTIAGQETARRSDAPTIASPELDAKQKQAEARSQVEQGLTLARSVRAGVSEYYIDHGEWPDSVTSVRGAAPLSDLNVKSITVVDGTIVIRYVETAAEGVAGKQLTLRPTILPYKTVYWTCGYAQPQGADPATGAAARLTTTIDPVYLPPTCL